MSSVLMNFMDSKIACRLGNPWELDRCPPAKPWLPGMEPFTHTIWPSPPPNLANWNDLRLLWRLQEFLLYPQSFPSKVCGRQPQSVLLAFASHSIRLPRVNSISVLITQSCPTLCNPVDCHSPGSSVHGILQARILEWVAMSSSRGSSRPRDGTQVSWTAASLPSEPAEKPSGSVKRKAVRPQCGAEVSRKTFPERPAMLQPTLALLWEN